MLVRLRTADGPVVRLTVDQGTTLRELKQRIIREGHSDEVDVELASDPAGTHGAYAPDSATLLALGIKHGDMLCVVRPSTAAGIVVRGGAWDVSQPKANEAPMPPAPARYLVGGSDGGVFAEEEYERARAAYQAYQEELQRRKRAEMLDRRGLAGMRGMTVDYIEWLEHNKFSIKSQDDSPCKQCSLDFAAANAFQAYMQTLHDSQMRYGVLYGTVDRESGVVSVSAIFEPPQHGDPTLYHPARAAAAADGAEGAADADRATAEADRLARLLGMRRVGWIFSHRADGRDHALSARDIGMAAKLQLEAESDDSDDEASADAFAHFVTIEVSIQSQGERHFEAYQLSEQCVEMARAGVLMPTSDGSEMRTLEPVKVEASETTAVDTDFFLVVVPITQHEGGPLRTAFPVENRELEPQTANDVRRVLESAPSGSTFTERIADFHLLLFLSHILDIETDMPALAAAVRERRELEPHEEGYKLLIESMA